MRIRARIAASGAFQVLWRQFSLVQRFVLPFYLLATIEEQLRRHGSNKILLRFRHRMRDDKDD